MKETNELVEFIFPVTNNVVRVTDQNGEPWFIRNDVCRELGHKNPSQATADNCKPDGVRNTEVIDSLGRTQLIAIINEANFYRLVMRSRVEYAIQFQDWVCEEVIPSIRKTGSYSLNPQISQNRLSDLLDDPKASNALMLELLTRNKKHEETIATQQKQIEAAAPKVAALDRLECADGSLCLRDAAKTLSVKEKDFFSHLKAKGWIYKRVGTAYWVAYADKLNSGLMEHKTYTQVLPDGSERVRTQAVVTARGLSRLSSELGGMLFN